MRVKIDCKRKLVWYRNLLLENMRQINVYRTKPFFFNWFFIIDCELFSSRKEVKTSRICIECFYFCTRWIINDYIKMSFAFDCLQKQLSSSFTCATLLQFRRILLFTTSNIDILLVLITFTRSVLRARKYLLCWCETNSNSNHVFQ